MRRETVPEEEGRIGVGSTTKTVRALAILERVAAGHPGEAGGGVRGRPEDLELAVERLARAVDAPGRGHGAGRGPDPSSPRSTVSLRIGVDTRHCEDARDLDVVGHGADLPVGPVADHDLGPVGTRSASSKSRTIGYQVDREPLPGLREELHVGLLVVGESTRSSRGGRPRAGTPGCRRSGRPRSSKSRASDVDVDRDQDRGLLAGRAARARRPSCGAGCPASGWAASRARWTSSSAVQATAGCSPSRGA